VSNGGFGTGDFSSWTDSVAGGGNSYVVDAATTNAPIPTFAIPAPPAGTYWALFDQVGPALHILYQEITIPAGYTSADFTATVSLDNNAVDYAIAATAGLAYDGGELNQQFRVDVMDPTAAVDDIGAGVPQNLYQTNPGDPLTETLLVSADLAPFAGQTVRLRFATVANAFFFLVGIDAVQVTAD
jgi:hypothetical protein